MVGNLAEKAGRCRVLHHDGHLFGLAQRKRFGHRAPQDVSASAGQQRKVARGDDHEAQVVYDRHEAEQRRGDREGDECRSDGHRPDELWLRRQAADQAQRGGTTRLATASSTLSGV